MPFFKEVMLQRRAWLRKGRMLEAHCLPLQAFPFAGCASRSQWSQHQLDSSYLLRVSISLSSLARHQEAQPPASEGQAGHAD